jgi:Right handed beta helix region
MTRYAWPSALIIRKETKMTTLTVGVGKQYAHLKDAVNASHDGDVINIDAGTYVNDFATVNHKITINGVGGMAHLVGSGNIPNGKAIMVTNTDVTLNHLEFSGAQVTDHNGAGIRYQGGHMTITNCYFHDNQDGILGGAVPTGVVDITTSEFAHNGYGDGQTHGLYIGEIASLHVADSYFHDTLAGHHIKSRADHTVIENNRLVDGTGTASYDIDLPNGGQAVVRGNIIDQGTKSENPAMIHFGGEGTAYAGSSLLIESNVLSNHLSNGYGLLNQTSVKATMDLNQLYNLAKVAVGPVAESGDTKLATAPTISTAHPWTLSTGAAMDAAPAPTDPTMTHHHHTHIIHTEWSHMG